MKPKQYVALVTDSDGFVATPRFQWAIHKNTRSTAREEAIAAKIIEQADPRNNISSRFPWGTEEQLILQQLWILPASQLVEWRDVPTEGGQDLYSVEQTESGPLPVPDAVKEPGMVRGDFGQRLKELLGDQ